MSCTRRFLNFRWEHHSWRRRVSSFETLVRQETNMWARVVESEFVRCDTQDVCAVCGKVRREVSCICDAVRAERCKLLRASIAESHHATA